MAKQHELRRTDGRVICERCTLADHAPSRLKGLLGRDSLPNGEGILDTLIRSDGSGMIHLHQKAGGSRMPPTAETVAKRLHYVHQEGAAVYKFAIAKMAEVAGEIMSRNNLRADMIQWLVPHQANRRIIESTAERMGLPMDPVMMTILGGIHYFLGPLWGSIIFISLRDQLSFYTEHWWIFFGAVLIALILLSPEGLSGIYERLRGSRRWALTRTSIPPRPQTLRPVRSHADPGPSARVAGPSSPTHRSSDTGTTGTRPRRRR